ncbi:hypothetical protein AMK21_21855 [Streptomyces sp. CB00316]|nr:hypothetical protein AMK21_21855 [Streptomyces sp. CB00316]
MVSPSKAAAWKTIPSWYLVATDDRAIGTENLRYMARRAGSTTVEVDAPHAVMETNPGAALEVRGPAVRLRLEIRSTIFWSRPLDDWSRPS